MRAAVEVVLIFGAALAVLVGMAVVLLDLRVGGLEARIEILEERR